MKALERIFLYTVLAILVFYVFLIDNNAESQVAIQEEIRARSILIVNDADQPVIMLWASEDGGAIVVSNNNNPGNPAAVIGADKDGGTMGVYNKAGNPVAVLTVYKDDDGLIEVYNKYGERTGFLP